jgi:cyclase
MAETSLFGAPARFAGGLQDLGGGAHVWLQPNGSLGESNAGLLVGDNASLLVDTLWDVPLTRRMLAAMAPVVEDAPIEVLVNSHSDGDHWWGNQLLAGRRIVTSDASARVMAEESVREIRSLLTLGAGLRLAGSSPLPYPKRDAVKTVGDYFSAIGRPYDWSGIELTHPTETFAGERELEVGGRTVRLIEVGPAHTPGDLIVVAPDARVCFAADILFVGVTPIMWAGPVENWIAALDRLDALDVDRFVPGHGPVCGRAEIAGLRGYWEWLREQGAQRHADGLSHVEAARELTRRPDGPLWSQPWGEWLNPERMIVNLLVIFAGLEGRPAPQGPRVILDAFREMALLARSLR